MSTASLTMVDDASPTRPSQINMTQPCKVCGEPAAGFHFGAFTCEGCKSFFGRTYNNLTSLNECKNDGHCIINKKTRTTCKSCRLRKCFFVGMSKSGSRYGRRSNWFKIHYLMNSNKTEEGTRSTSAFTDYPSPTREHRNSTSPVEERSKSAPIKSPSYVTPSSLNPFTDRTHNHLALLNHLTRHQATIGKSDSPPSPKSTSPPSQPELPYSNDILSLYSQLPLGGPGGVSPFMNPTAAIAQRLLYPYYPSLLNWYSQSQFLESSLHGKRSPPQSSSSDYANEDDAVIERPLKIRKTSMSPVPTKWAPKLPPTPPMVDIFPVSTQTRETHLKTESPDIPIDLRIRTKVFEVNCSRQSPSSDSDSSTDRISIKTEVQSACTESSKSDQQCPLDLSSFKS